MITVYAEDDDSTGEPPLLDLTCRRAAIHARHDKSITTTSGWSCSAWWKAARPLAASPITCTAPVNSSRMRGSYRTSLSSTLRTFSGETQFVMNSPLDFPLGVSYGGFETYTSENSRKVPLCYVGFPFWVSRPTTYIASRRKTKDPEGIGNLPGLWSEFLLWSSLGNQLAHLGQRTLGQRLELL
jgi:hypothetical protein